MAKEILPYPMTEAERRRYLIEHYGGDSPFRQRPEPQEDPELGVVKIKLRERPQGGWAWSVVEIRRESRWTSREKLLRKGETCGWRAYQRALKRAEAAAHIAYKQQNPHKREFIYDPLKHRAKLSTDAFEQEVLGA